MMDRSEPVDTMWRTGRDEADAMPPPEAEPILAALRDGLRRLITTPRLAADPEFQRRLADLEAAASDSEAVFVALDAVLDRAAQLTDRAASRTRRSIIPL